MELITLCNQLHFPAVRTGLEYLFDYQYPNVALETGSAFW